MDQIPNICDATGFKFNSYFDPSTIFVRTYAKGSKIHLFCYKDVRLLFTYFGTAAVVTRLFSILPSTKGWRGRGGGGRNLMERKADLELRRSVGLPDPSSRSSLILLPFPPPIPRKTQKESGRKRRRRRREGKRLT